ncbi:MAG: ATP-binding protein [Sedimenticola sp.]
MTMISAICRSFFRTEIFILFLVLMALHNHTCFAAESTLQNRKTILVLHTLQAQRPWVLLFNRYLSEYLQQANLPSYSLDIENLDLIKSNDRYHKTYLKKMLVNKYKKSPPDIIVAVIGSGIKFVVENDLFPDVPKIFVAPTTSEFKNTPNSKLILYGYDHKGNIAHALELMPDTKKIYVVAGSGSVDKRSVAAFDRKTEEFKTRIVFEYLTEMDIDKLMVRVANLPPNSFVYYLPYTFDPFGKTVIGLDMVRQIGKRSNRPVLTYLDLFALNTGILGGRVTTTQSRAASSADIIKRVFQGEAIESINAIPQYFEYIYDWGELVKWDVDVTKLPPNSTIQNRTYTFYELFKWQILTGITLLIVQAVFIGILLANTRKRKLAELKLQRYRAALENRVRERTAELEMARDDAENAKEAAVMSSQAKSQFLANMSHELRTPLNAVLGFSQLMNNDKGLNGHQKSNLEIINRSGHHLLQLINDVLDMSKIEAGRTVLEIENIDMGALTQDVTDMMRVRAEAKGLQLLIDQASDFPRYVRADGPKIRQILINLVSNAIKFTETGGITLRLAAGNAGAKHITLRGEVQDTGIGISPEDIERIFVPFEQLVDSVTQKGTGLGLAITRQFVELMGGDISAASQPGKGTTFHFHIHVEPGSPELIQAVNKRAARQVIGLRDAAREWRILIVEDQLENQQLLHQLLTQTGFQVRIADDGIEAIELFEEWHPHFIWMDWRMPRMDGLTATRKIRELPDGKEVKIAALTASVFREQTDEIMAGGSDDFVRKPYRSEQIFDCMARHLDLDYLFEEEVEDATAEVTGEIKAIPEEQLAALPPDLRDTLDNALTLLDVEEIRQVMKHIEAIAPELAAALGQRVEAFEFTAIKKLLHK